MQDNRCPNCGGQLEMNQARTRWVCPFCDSSFAIAKLQEEQTFDDRGCGLNPEFFSFDRDLHYSFSLEKTGVSLNAMKRCMNELEHPAAIEEHIRKHLLNDEDVAAEGVNQRRIDAVRATIAPDLQAGEHIILYGDNGIFSRGKDYFVVTDRRSIFIGKRMHKVLPHHDVEFIEINDSGDIPQFRLNGDIDKNISAVGAKYELQGSVAALICLYAFEGNADRRKIRLV